MKPRYFTILLLLMLILGAGIVRAQDTCSAQVQEAMARLDQNCAEMGRNTVCYGNTQIQATFAETPLELQFAVPSDRIALNFLAGLRAGPLDENEETWGLAVMNTQANLPGTLPGQGVVMLVMGDTEVTNEVPANDAFLPAPPLDLRVNVDGARLRSGAGLNFTVAGVAQVGETVQADAKNEAGDWVRVVYNEDVAGWMFADLLDVTAEQLDGLPVIDPTIRTPMQAFYFTTGLGNPRCNEAPDAVLIQSPQRTRVTMTINAAEITLGSTIYMETDPASGDMILYVLDGVAEVNNLIVPEGYRAVVSTVGNVQTVTDLAAAGITTVTAQELPEVSGQWRSCTVIDAADRQRLSELPNIPASLLNYPVTLPGTPTQFCASPAELAALQQPTTAPVPTTAPTVPGATPAPVTVVPGETEQVVTGLDCSTFRIASPREGMAFGFQTFFWDPTNPGAASYDVFVYGNDGNLVAQGSTAATSIDLDTGDANPNGGATYSWTVQARDAAGNVICGPLEPAFQLREAAPPMPPDDDDDDGGDNDNLDDDDDDNARNDDNTCDVSGLYKDAESTCAYGAEVDEGACTFSCLEDTDK
ncbi:MAG: SH3 domain-containing protein [Chloroflexota bacterium]